MRGPQRAVVPETPHRTAHHPRLWLIAASISASASGQYLAAIGHEFLTIGVAAIYLVKPARCVARSAYNRSARENIVYERSGLATVKQTGAPVGLQADNHGNSLYRCMKTSNRGIEKIRFF